MAKTGTNVFDLDDWMNFYQSKKWTVYCGVVDQYSTKYRKVYQDGEGKNNITDNLSSPTKSKNPQLKTILKGIMEHLKTEKYRVREMGEGK